MQPQSSIPPTRILLIGSGHVAEALAAAWSGCGKVDVLLRARNGVRAAAIAARWGVTVVPASAPLPAADLYLIAVSDSAVGTVARELTALPGIDPDAVVAHTAGSVGLDALPAAWPARGVFYPFQTFTKGRTVDFSRIPLFVEGSSPEVVSRLTQIGKSLTERCFEADSSRRRMIHLAGVFANNFANAMYGIGGELMARAGFGFDMLRELILETAAKAAASEDPAAVQTGPAVRGDFGVQAAHCELLRDDEALQRIYQTVSERIWEISKKTS